MKFVWQHIEFADGSNPYICKTEAEFRRLQKKYCLRQIKCNFWEAKERMHKDLKPKTSKQTIRACRSFFRGNKQTQ